MDRLLDPEFSGDPWAQAAIGSRRSVPGSSSMASSSEYQMALYRAVVTVNHCQHPGGGYGGGPGQAAHLASTYAAVHALAILGTDEAYDSIDRLLCRCRELAAGGPEFLGLEKGCWRGCTS